jgi:hypothetical protein
MGVVLGMLVEDVAVDLSEPRSATTVETAAFPGWGSNAKLLLLRLLLLPPCLPRSLEASL